MRNAVLVTTALVLASSLAADYAADLKAAKALSEAKKNDEAIAAFVTLAEKTTIRDRNAECLREAALVANGMKDVEKAMELAKQIRNGPLSKACQMELMIKNQTFQRLIDAFKDEDVARWQENCVGQGYYYRGVAYNHLKDFQNAETELANAVKYSVSVDKDNAMLSLGDVYLNGLRDEKKATETYQRLAAEGQRYCWSTGVGLRNAVALLNKQKRFDESKELLAEYDITNKESNWSATALELYAKTYAAEGKTDKAIDAFEKARANKTVKPRDVKRYKQAIEALRTPPPTPVDETKNAKNDQ